MKDPNFSIAFTVGKFTIYWYAILLALGIAAAVAITDRRTRGRQLPKDIALDLCILGVPFGVLGARLFACLSGTVAWGDFFDLSRAGLSFFGGIVFAGLAMLGYLKLRKADVGEMLDAGAPGIFAGIGIAIWGDFFNRTNYGPLVQHSALKWFPLATYGDDLKVHYATFFYEFLLCVVLIVLYYALLRKRMQRKGSRFLVMALIYCLGRFCIDGIRQGLPMAGPLAFDQVCEIVLFVLCLCLLLVRRPPQPAAEEPAAEPEEPTVEEDGAADETVEPAAGEQDAPEPATEKDLSGLE